MRRGEARLEPEQTRDRARDRDRAGLALLNLMLGYWDSINYQ